MRDRYRQNHEDQNTYQNDMNKIGRKRVTVFTVLQQANKHFLPLKVKVCILTYVGVAGLAYFGVGYGHTASLPHALIIACVPLAIVFWLWAAMGQRSKQDDYDNLYLYDDDEPFFG
jgi:hypothetical protein